MAKVHDEAGLDDADYAALAQFRHTLRQFQAFSESRAAACGLTPQQHQALLAIRAAPAGRASIGYVAERLILKPHSASGLVERLETLGLLERSASPDDRRQIQLALTDRARGVLASLSATHREEIRRLRPMLADLLARLG
jgi:DNA-binding MarR family transcriptional regulator